MKNKWDKKKEKLTPPKRIKLPKLPILRSDAPPLSYREHYGVACSQALIISAARRAFIHPREESRRVGERFGGGWALMLKASYFPSAKKRNGGVDAQHQLRMISKALAMFPRDKRPAYC